MDLVLLAIPAIAVLSTAVAGRLGHRPGSKRRHLFETDDGDRGSPFGNPSAGASAPPACRGCGTALESPAFRYCSSCHALESADD